MRNSLRKVSFKLKHYEFDPDTTPNQEAEMKRLSKEREGYFHRWVDDVDNSKDIPYVKTMALVEELENSSMHVIEYYNLTFKEK